MINALYTYLSNKSIDSCIHADLRVATAAEEWDFSALAAGKEEFTLEEKNIQILGHCWREQDPFINCLVNSVSTSYFAFLACFSISPKNDKKFHWKKNSYCCLYDLLHAKHIFRPPLKMVKTIWVKEKLSHCFASWRQSLAGCIFRLALPSPSHPAGWDRSQQGRRMPGPRVAGGLGTLSLLCLKRCQIVLWVSDSKRNKINYNCLSQTERRILVKKEPTLS